MSDMKTIRITGRGHTKVFPDTTRIMITLGGVYEEYSDALEHSIRDARQLKEMLSEYDFDRGEVKTLSFGVDTEYERYKENDEYKERFAGYRYTQRLKLEFTSDNLRLGKILYALSTSPFHPELRLGYAVSDPEQARNFVLGQAIKDAKEKAEALTRAAGVTLGDIQNIDYSWGEIDFEVNPIHGDLRMMAAAMDESECYDLDIEADAIDFSNTVTVIWEIK